VAPKQFQNIAKILCLVLTMLHSTSYALESSIQAHKVDQDESFGYSLSIGDEFFNQKAFNWQVNYTHLEHVAISDLDKISGAWDEADFDFSLDNIDLMIGYRYYPKSYNKFIKTLMFEFQVGGTVNLNDHKLVFRPDFDRDDIYFAEQGDINPVVAISIQKSFTKNSAIHIGIKHYPSYSDFGSISTLFIGFNYRFGRQFSY
jgi:hypothetical protein